MHQNMSSLVSERAIARIRHVRLFDQKLTFLVGKGWPIWTILHKFSLPWTTLNHFWMGPLLQMTNNFKILAKALVTVHPDIATFQLRKYFVIPHAWTTSSQPSLPDRATKKNRNCGNLSIWTSTWQWSQCNLTELCTNICPLITHMYMPLCDYHIISTICKFSIMHLDEGQYANTYISSKNTEHTAPGY